jgi:hypothetical protein
MSDRFYDDILFDGFGGMLQRHILAYCVTSHRGDKFVFPGFYELIMKKGKNRWNIESYWEKILNDMGEDFLHKITHFLNFNEMSNNATPMTWKEVKTQLVLDESRDYLKRLRKGLLYEAECYFENKKNVCWHIRTASDVYDNVNEIKNNNREIGIPSQKRINNVIKLAKSKLGDFKLYIISNDDNLHKKMCIDNCDFEFKLNDDMLSDLYHMIHADLLICANSSYSYCAYLLNGHITAIRDNFVMPTFSDSIFLDANYETKI